MVKYNFGTLDLALRPEPIFLLPDIFICIMVKRHPTDMMDNIVFLGGSPKIPQKTQKPRKDPSKTIFYIEKTTIAQH